MKDKILTGTGTFIAILISLAILFKIMHWPGANMMGMVSFFSMIIIYIPLYFINGIKNAATKSNTITTSILMLAGCGLFLALARTPAASQKQYVKNTESFIRNEKIFQVERKQNLNINTKASVQEINQLSIDILNSCELLKSGILEWETGYKVLPEDYKNKNAWISDGWVRIYFKASHAQSLLEKTRKQVALFNSLTGETRMVHNLPVEAFDFDKTEERVGDALTDIIQVQMMVLQNLKGLRAL